MNDPANTLMVIGFAIAFSVGAFLALRTLMLWYWRVDEILLTLKQIDRKLGVLADDVPTRGKFQFNFLESIDKKLGKLAEERSPGI